jgi:hemerythrin
MSVGVPALDADHRGLFRVVNLLRSIRHDPASGATVGEILETLEAYGRNHFRREEEVMAAVNFPGARFHESEHRGFARYIEDLQKAARDGTDPHLAATLFEYMTGWLRHHILIQDMAYKPYVRDAKLADQVAACAAPALANEQAFHAQA